MMSKDGCLGQRSSWHGKSVRLEDVYLQTQKEINAKKGHPVFLSQAWSLVESFLEQSKVILTVL